MSQCRFRQVAFTAPEGRGDGSGHGATIHLRRPRPPGPQWASVGLRAVSVLYIEAVSMFA